MVGGLRRSAQRAPLLGALWLLPTIAAAGYPTPLFCALRVTLNTGVVVEGQGWLYNLVDLDGARELRFVELDYDPPRLSITGQYADSEEPVSREFEYKPGGKSLGLFGSHERFDYTNSTYFLPRDERLVRWESIRRIDIVAVIGRGNRIHSDPRRFENVPDPYIFVDDCGLGCRQKLHSNDPSVTREALQKLWDEHFSCEKRGRFWPHNAAVPEDWGDPQKFALFHEHRLELVSNPTCLD